MGVNASVIQKIYIAYFNRPADVPGLIYWEKQLDDGKISLAGLAQSFSVQVEYLNTYGNKPTAEVITAIYKNLFARSPDFDGLKYWSNQIDSNAVNMGTAALAILSGASPDSLDGLTIANKLSFATTFTNNLDTPSKQLLYTSSDKFEIARDILSQVKGSTSIPSLALTKTISIPAALDGLNKIEVAQGVSASIDLTGAQIYAGYKIELMNGEKPFATPITYSLTSADVAAKKVNLSIPSGTFFGSDGFKFIGVKINDVFGNAGNVSGQTSVYLDTTPPDLPKSYDQVLKWIYSSTSSGPYRLLDQVFSFYKININAGSDISRAALQLSGENIAQATNIKASDTSITFEFSEAVGAQVYKSWMNQNNGLSLVLTDSVGNRTVSELSSFQITQNFSYVPGSPATNIIIEPIGGTIVSNTINKTNTNLHVSAKIDPLEYVLERAVLKLNGVEIATDINIYSWDTTVDFYFGTTTNAELQAIVKNGGTLSVTMYDHNKKAVESLVNPKLFTNYVSILQDDSPVANMGGLDQVSLLKQNVDQSPIVQLIGVDHGNTVVSYY